MFAGRHTKGTAMDQKNTVMGEFAFWKMGIHRLALSKTVTY